MPSLYEIALRWLTIWLPYRSRLRDHLAEATYLELEGEFWAAIAPSLNDVPWQQWKLVEYMRKIQRPPTPMEAAADYRRVNYEEIPF